MNKLKYLSLVSSVLLITACGGGGGSGGGSATTPTTTVFPVLQALTYAYTNGLQNTLNVTGTANGGSGNIPVTGTGTFTIGKIQPGFVFNGVGAYQTTTTISGSVTLNGTTVPTNSSVAGYLNQQFQALGEDSVGNYCVATTPWTYPATATVGQTGTLGTENCYTDSTKRISVGSQTASYVTTAGPNNTLNVQIITNIYTTSNTLKSSGSTTYNVTPTGMPSLVGLVISQTTSGVTLNLTYQ